MPDAFSRWRDGPVFVPSNTNVQLASLAVPAGSYVIFGKGYAKLHGGGGTKLALQLTAGSDFDRLRVGIDATENHVTHARRSDETGFALNVLHSFAAPGTITLTCSCDADDLDVSFIKITAIHVTSFSNLPE